MDVTSLSSNRSQRTAESMAALRALQVGRAAAETMRVMISSWMAPGSAAPKRRERRLGYIYMHVTDANDQLAHVEKPVNDARILTPWRRVGSRRRRVIFKRRRQNFGLTFVTPSIPRCAQAELRLLEELARE